MSKIAGISKSLKIEIVGLDNFLFSKIKKNQTNLKKNEINLNLFSEMYRMKKLNLNWIDWSGTDKLIIH